MKVPDSMSAAYSNAQSALLIPSDMADCATRWGLMMLGSGRVCTISCPPPACQSRLVFSYYIGLWFIVLKISVTDLVGPLLPVCPMNSPPLGYQGIEFAQTHRHEHTWAQYTGATTAGVI